MCLIGRSPYAKLGMSAVVRNLSLLGTPLGLHMKCPIKNDRGGLILRVFLSTCFQCYP